MSREIIYSLRLTAMTIILCVVAYTCCVLGAAHWISPEKRMGSLILAKDGKVIGSRLIGQAFLRPEYLWPRPSAVDYNAGAAGGSNLSPTNPKLRERAERIVQHFALGSATLLPADIVTASGSGLDPHISLASALLQAERIAKSRGLGADQIRKQMQQQAKQVGINADADAHLLNVLEFNLFLDTQVK